MDSPEIDEAAAVGTAQRLLQEEPGLQAFPWARNLARAALEWKSRAEAAEAELRRSEAEINRMLLHGFPCDCKDCR